MRIPKCCVLFTLGGRDLRLKLVNEDGETKVNEFSPFIEEVQGFYRGTEY